MIVDKARIFIKAGDGGNGAISFHREKYVIAGGPDGGDGGNGGNLIFQASNDLRTLTDFKFTKKYVAQNGENGRKSNMKGKTGEDLIINVPPGTVIYDEEGRLVADIGPNDRRIVLKGGKGGKGNARFATPTRRAPRFATPGQKTIGRFVVLELKSIADVGLIGFPNVGKSTLLSAITQAKPKIANYHFTTISPNLGVASYHGKDFVVADIPGLIEGASQGAGLGHDFLRHIERTRVLVHILDASGIEGRDPLSDYQKIRDELFGYSKALAKKPEIVLANKMDLTGAEKNLQKLKEALAKENVPVLPISAATRDGMSKAMEYILAMLDDLPAESGLLEEGVIEEWAEQDQEKTFEISRGMDGVVEVNGGLIDEIFQKIDPEDYHSMRHFEKLMRDFGIIAALRDFGVKDGEEVRLNGETFDFVE